LPPEDLPSSEDFEDFDDEPDEDFPDELLLEEEEDFCLTVLELADFDFSEDFPTELELFDSVLDFFTLLVPDELELLFDPEFRL